MQSNIYACPLTHTQEENSCRCLRLEEGREGKRRGRGRDGKRGLGRKEERIREGEGGRKGKRGRKGEKKEGRLVEI